MLKAFLRVSCLEKFSLIIRARDQVLEDQPIDRYVNDNLFEAQCAAMEKAILTVQSLSAEIRSLRVMFATTKPALERKLVDATCTVSQLEYLVNAGAEPSVKLAFARANLHDLEALSSFTAREAALDRAVQQANLTVKGACRHKCGARVAMGTQSVGGLDLRGARLIGDGESDHARGRAARKWCESRES